MQDNLPLTHLLPSLHHARLLLPPQLVAPLNVRLLLWVVLLSQRPRRLP